LDHWRATLAPGGGLVPAVDDVASTVAAVDHDRAYRRSERARVLSSTRAEALCGHIPSAARATVQEALLAVVYETLTTWRGERWDGASSSALVVDVDTDARRDTAGAGLGRTVGPLAGSHPVRLDPGPHRGVPALKR